MISYKKKLSEILLFCGIAFLVPCVGLAKEETKNKNVDFSVKAIQPDTQVDRGLSFFYPAIEPGKKQKLELELHNTGDKKVDLDIDLVNATTALGGRINYNQKNAKLDESMNYPLTDIAKISENSVTLKKGETKTINVDITPKKEKFPGIKLGAVRILKHMDKKKESGISTNYGYVVGLIATEDKKPYDQGGDLVYKKTEAKIINGKKMAATTFQNPKPYIIQNLEMTATLFKEGEKKAYGEKVMKGMSIAPNSTFDYGIDLGLKNLEFGKYRVEINAKNDQDKWSWNETFEVSSRDADKMNKDAAYKLALPSKYYNVLKILISVTLIIIILQLILFIRGRRREKVESIM